MRVRHPMNRRMVGKRCQRGGNLCQLGGLGPGLAEPEPHGAVFRAPEATQPQQIARPQSGWVASHHSR